MSNWKAGDIAIYDGPVGDPLCVDLISPGDEVTLVSREFMDDEWVWFIDLEHEDYRFCADEKYLRKRPNDNLFTEWFNNTIITDIRPTERQVREGSKC